MNRQSRAGFNMIWMLSIFLCTAAALFAVFFVSCSRSPAKSAAALEAASAQSEAELAPTAAPEPTATPEPTPPPVILAETEDMGEEYLSKIVFLGDSTTYGLGVFDILPFSQVWVPNNGTLTLSNQSFTDIDYYDDDGTVASMSIADAAAARKPEYLIITLGLNGISFMEEAAFKAEYIALIDSIKEASPDTKIICHSIYPVIDSLVTSDIGNARVNRANGWLVDIPTETGTRYLNTHDSLMDETGNLIADYNSGVGDGIHFNVYGYEAILHSVRTHGYQ